MQNLKYLCLGHLVARIYEFKNQILGYDSNYFKYTIKIYICRYKFVNDSFLITYFFIFILTHNV